jgi:hypothetical protein
MIDGPEKVAQEPVRKGITAEQLVARKRFRTGRGEVREVHEIKEGRVYYIPIGTVMQGGMPSMPIAQFLAEAETTSG